MPTTNKLDTIRLKLYDACVQAMKECKTISNEIDEDNVNWEVMSITHDIADKAHAELARLSKAIIDGQI